MDIQLKIILFFTVFTLYVGIYLCRIVPLLQRYDKFDEYKFWFNPVYIFDSCSTYYEICKNNNLPLGWFHMYQLNFILWCLLLLV